MSSGPDIEPLARREIEELHKFFVDWFTGKSVQHMEFATCERAFAPDFAMITPSGDRHDRKTIVDRLRQARGSARGAFAIAIREPRTVWLRDDAILVEYIEQQSRDGRTTRRRSTALLTPDQTAPRQMLWRFLQETWMNPDEVA